MEAALEEDVRSCDLDLDLDLRFRRRLRSLSLVSPLSRLRRLLSLDL